MPEGQATAVFAQLRPIYGGWERGGQANAVFAQLRPIYGGWESLHTENRAHVLRILKPGSYNLRKHAGSSS